MPASKCQRCGEPLPERAKFCPNCGAPVVSAARERKLVTIVFADLTASTELAAGLDPERFREVLAAFYELVAGRISALRGRPEQYIGDAVMGVFGVPVSRDDDAVRAIRAGLEIVQRAERLGRDLGLARPLRVRVGVNTGPVAVGEVTSPSLVSGAEVNLAARIQQAAEPGEVLVGSTTFQLSLAQVEFGEERAISAKGFAGTIPVWPALRVKSAAGRTSIRLVDRRRELALLEDTFERVAERERAHLVTLLGEPGIGKSRVVEEFLSGLDEGVKVLQGRASSFEENVAFRPIAQMVLREIGDPSDDVDARLRELVREWVEPGEIEQAAHRLALALGLDDDDGEEHRYQAAEVREGLRTLLTGLATKGPVVVVFEDLHQADPVLLDVIEQLVRSARKLPLLVLCVARWDFLEERPGWAGGIADAVTLWVEPLSERDSVELAEEAGDLNRADAERVARHAGGNPFFIVEITGMLRREERGVPTRTAAASSRLLPATVQLAIAARLDALSTEARELVRRASVFARGAFDVSELALIADPARELLEELEDEELLVRDDDRPTVWAFRSDVLRDVAYESLAKRERQRLHLRVANKLSEDRADQYPRTIAYHLEQAARAALDLNPGDRGLAERAIIALAHAGDLARRRMESRAAADLFERALALSGPDDSWNEREAWVLSQLGESRYWLGEFDLAEPSLRRALELAPDDAAVRAHASRFLADITLTYRGDTEPAEALFEQALDAARTVGDSRALARTLLMAGWVPFWRNELGLARSMFDEALKVSRGGPGRDAWAESRALVGLSVVSSPERDELDALALAQEALAVGEAAGQAFTVAVAHETVAASLRKLMRLDDALTQSEPAIRTFRDLDSRWELASALGDRGSMHRLAARLDEAETDLREAYRLCRDLRERALVTWTAAELARVLVAKGDPAGARQVLNEPPARIAAGEPGSRTAILTAECVLALAEGDRDTALQKSLASIDAERGERGVPNPLAAQIWWTAQLFGVDEAGGTAAVDEARERLERHHWAQALAEPGLLG